MDLENTINFDIIKNDLNKIYKKNLLTFIENNKTKFSKNSYNMMIDKLSK